MEGGGPPSCIHLAVQAFSEKRGIGAVFLVDAEEIFNLVEEAGEGLDPHDASVVLGPVACVAGGDARRMRIFFLALRRADSPNHQDALGRTALYDSVRYCNRGSSMECVRALLAAPGIDVNLASQGWSPLMKAARYCNRGSSLECVKALLAAPGVDFSAVNNNSGWTALMLASRFCKETVRLSVCVSCGGCRCERWRQRRYDSPHVCLALLQGGRGQLVGVCEGSSCGGQDRRHRF